jgi:tetratricopeptide (TPR) repeat protein
MEKIIFALILGTLAPAGLEAASPPADTLATGNAAYEKGDFAAARQAYESVAAQGYGGLALEYNLGNTYYRLGRIGRARLWYERARLADPGDDDARYNLDTIRRKVNETEGGRNPLADNAAPLRVLATVLNILFWVLAGTGLFLSREWLWWARLGTGLAGAGALVLVVLAGNPAGMDRAVLVAPAEVRSGPGEDYAVGFTAPEGKSVLYLETRDRWTQIGLPDQGLKGWAPRESVIRIHEHDTKGDHP